MRSAPRVPLLALAACKQSSTPDFFIGVSGLRVGYDKTRAPFDPYGGDPTSPGWIVRLARVDASGAEAEVLYDATLAQPWGATAFDLQPIVTTYQVGAYASAFGATLKDASGAPIALGDAVLSGPAGNHVKDHQALAMYVRGVCAANGGELPSSYDASTTLGALPQRVVCTGAICP